MKSLYWRIYLTVVFVLAVFAFGATWLFQRQIEHERGTADAAANERLHAIAVLLQGALPAATAPPTAQAHAVEEWGQRLHIPLALEDSKGQRIGASEYYRLREDLPGQLSVQVPLDDGRHLVFMQRATRPPVGASHVETGEGRDRRVFLRPDRVDPRLAAQRREELAPEAPLMLMPKLLHSEGLLAVLVLLFFGIAGGAFPVVRRLTRRLEQLRSGVQAFGDGQLNRRVEVGGNDELAQLAHSFNEAAGRIEALLHSHRSLLANASHEIRSPLARLKMAFSMLDSAAPAQKVRLQLEIDTNIRELDALVEEVLLASRLEAGAVNTPTELIDVMGIVAEEAARVGAQILVQDEKGLPPLVCEERLVRRALRNLLENARRYGGADVQLEVAPVGQRLEFRVSDRGPGVPVDMRERIFEPFFRLPGHAEQAGGVGLGLSLVKQIAARHHGSVHCESREGGGSVFVLSLPLQD